MDYDAIKFEKIIRKKKKGYKDLEKEKYKDQVFGSIHTIPDRKVHFDGRFEDDYKEYSRPGVVTNSPFDNELFETEWAPGSSKLARRVPEETIFVAKGELSSTKDMVYLLAYRSFYKPETLSRRKAKFDYDKLEELEKKLGAL